MRRFLISAAAIAALFVAVSGVATADEGMQMSMGKEKEKDSGPAVDPVSGKKVTAEEAPEAIFLDTLFRFESAENLAKFRAEPEKYATVACPVSGEPVRIRDAKVKTVSSGRTWYFCCGDCIKKFEEDPREVRDDPVSGLRRGDSDGGCCQGLDRGTGRLFLLCRLQTGIREELRQVVRDDGA